MSKLTNWMLDWHYRPGISQSRLLEHALYRLGLSTRTIRRILKAVRSITGLNNSVDIRPAHLSEAISYRRLERMAKHG